MTDEIFQDPITLSAILGAITKKTGPVTLSEKDFVFENDEEDIILVYNDDDTITIGLGVHHEES